MPRFFLQDPSGYFTNFDSDYEVTTDYVEETGNVSADFFESTSEAFADHPTTMKVTSTTDGEGVYHDITVEGGIEYRFEFDYYMPTAAKEIDFIVYDQTNGAPISTGTLTYTQQWFGHYESVDTPATCTTVRLFFRPGENSMDYYLDRVRFQGNLIEFDAERGYSRPFPDQRNVHNKINGSVTVDRTGRRFAATMHFEPLSAARYDKIMKAVRSSSASFWDDGDLPQMVNIQTLYPNTDYDYIGVTNPSAGSAAYYDSSASLPAASGDFEATEFSTANYQVVDGYGAPTVDTTLSVAADIKKYIYHKYVIDVSGEYSAITDIRGIWIRYWGEGEDLSDNGLDGLIMYAWNGSTWMRLQKGVGPGEQLLFYSVTEPAQAQDFVDIASGEVQVLIRTLGQKGSTGNLTLKSNYIQVKVNKDVRNDIILTHKAQLDGGADVVSVENLTTGSGLTLGTHYKIGDGLNKITALSPGAGQRVKVTYIPQLEVNLGTVNDDWLPTGTPTTPPRRLSLTLAGTKVLTELSE